MSQSVHGELVPVGGGDPIPLVRDVLTLGRRDSCDIPLHYPNVSSVHCCLTFMDGYWWIKDEGSTNGVKVNGIRVTRKLPHPGLGDHHCQAQMEDHVRASGGPASPAGDGGR